MKLNSLEIHKKIHFNFQCNLFEKTIVTLHGNFQNLNEPCEIKMDSFYFFNVLNVLLSMTNFSSCYSKEKQKKNAIKNEQLIFGKN